MVKDTHVTGVGSVHPYDMKVADKLDFVKDLIGFRWAELSPNEFKLAMWLLRNTFLRGNTSGCYSHQQMTDGIPDTRTEDGMYCLGTGLPDKTLRRTLASLLDKRVIRLVRKTRSGAVYTVNLNWDPTNPYADQDNVVMLRTPTQARKAPKKPALHKMVTEEYREENTPWGGQWGGQFDHPPPVNLTVQGGQIGTPSKDIQGQTNKGQTIERPTSPVATARIRDRSFLNRADKKAEKAETLSRSESESPNGKCLENSARRSTAEAVEAAKAKHAQKVAQAKQTNDMASYEVTWKAAWAEGQFETRITLGWTKAQFGMIKTVVARWPAQGLGKFHDFLHWTVVNWGPILRSQFKWMTKSTPPAQPDVAFLVRFIDDFQDAWCQKETITWVGTLSGTEQQIAHKMAHGMTRDAAILDVAKDQAVAVDRERRQKDIAYANRTLEVAKRMKKNAESINATRFTKDNPHPRAHENKRTQHAPLIEDRDPDAPIMVEMADFSAFFKD